tara:strand:+ start:34 stop:756 length:723 start_codon:yes stop_codon:yes gene_type:complete
MKDTTLIIVPVLNEVGNIYPLIKKINKNLKVKKKEILFIDDNSTDGTRSKILELSKNHKYIRLIKRKKKLGIGSAHKDALKWGFKKKYKIIITMDCDGTHDPIYINSMIKILQKENFSIVSTNRFLNKNALRDWTLWRKFLTSLRHNLIKFLLRMKYDSSGAFRAYLTEKINLKDIQLAKNNSYSFFWESAFILSKKYKIKEIPIFLPGRNSGSSKMRIKDILSAFLYLIYFTFIGRFKI